MVIIGLDLHKRESQLSITADDGTITDRRMTGAWRPAYRLSEARRHMFAPLNA